MAAGTLVVLDKMAGEQVDLFVNGQCIAKGDIVVVEDNFGIRITEIGISAAKVVSIKMSRVGTLPPFNCVRRSLICLPPSCPDGTPDICPKHHGGIRITEIVSREINPESL